MKLEIEKLKILWFTLGILATITFVALMYNEIGAFLAFHSLGMSIKHAFRACILSGTAINIITLAIAVFAFFQWKITLVLNLIISYSFFHFSYILIFMSKGTFTYSLMLARNISAIGGTLMSICGLILLAIYVWQFFKRKNK